ncbi:hypothetical protein M885DRAFT_37313 [Pelagophyceae sp. CCMP2097]|nr:hypothetical protein M885DRAFT_37313 [Pelagophyceae sp. CCMP2097]
MDGANTPAAAGAEAWLPERRAPPDMLPAPSPAQTPAAVAQVGGAQLQPAPSSLAAAASGQPGEAGSEQYSGLTLLSFATSAVNPPGAPGPPPAGYAHAPPGALLPLLGQHEGYPGSNYVVHHPALYGQPRADVMQQPQYGGLPPNAVPLASVQGMPQNVVPGAPAYGVPPSMQPGQPFQFVQAEGGGLYPVNPAGYAAAGDALRASMPFGGGALGEFMQAGPADAGEPAKRARADDAAVPPTDATAHEGEPTPADGGAPPAQLLQPPPVQLLQPPPVQLLQPPPVQLLQPPQQPPLHRRRRASSPSTSSRRATS